MLTTPAEVVRLALRGAGILGVGQSALPEDYSDAFDLLNGMVSAWNRRRWLVFHLLDISCVTTGAVSYTIGPGCDLETAALAGRVDRLESAFFRQTLTAPPNQVDFPMEVLESREDYNLIRLKKLTSTLPRWIFLDSDWPTGIVYPWPIAAAGVGEIHVTVKQAIGGFTSFTQDLDLPPEYREALWSNLALRLNAAYPGSWISEQTMRIAQSSLEAIRGANVQIPRLRMPRFLANKSRYDAFSDSFY